MNIKMLHDWKDILKDEFEKPYFHELVSYVRKEYKTNKCFPPGNQIFEAFNRCKFTDIKAVILGQDPYHGVGQAHGLCFSVNKGVKYPPSLKNIFIELKNDLGVPTPDHGCLDYWADQGVLLLNATLTVRSSMAGSHQKKGWELFTDNVIKKISEQRSSIVFMLWGGMAKKKEKIILPNRHLILKSGHPSPLSANKGHWFGNKHFSQANSYLEENGKNTIDWRIN